MTGAPDESGGRPALQPSAPQLSRPRAAPAASGEVGVGAFGLKGNTAFIWIGGAAGLLVAALFSVGLFDTPTSPNGVASVEERRSNSGSSLIRPVSAGESEAAIGRLMMSDPDKQKIRAALAEGKLRLGWVTLSDIQAEDGDWVRFMAGGFRQDVRLLHKSYTIAVPYMPGLPVTVMGLVDGGGGDITVAVYVNAARVSLRPLKKGETLQIPTP